MIKGNVEKIKYKHQADELVAHNDADFAYSLHRLHYFPFKAKFTLRCIVLNTVFSRNKKHMSRLFSLLNSFVRVKFSVR